MLPGRLALARYRIRFALTAVALSFGLPDDAEAYRFLLSRDDLRKIVTAEDAPRWVGWGSGRTLEWTLDTRVNWSNTWYGSRTGIRRVVQTALDAWSDIPHADISWEIADEASTRPGTGHPQPRRTNWITVQPGTGWGAFQGHAYVWWRRSGSEFVIENCSVLLYGSPAEGPLPDWRKALPEDNPERTHPGLQSWIHELGHCLGLDHAESLATTSDFRVPLDDEWMLWKQGLHVDPQMSYGNNTHGILDHPVTADDAAGAALLRPARGWRATTGAISGSLLLDGGPVPYAHVWAFPEAAIPCIGLWLCRGDDDRRPAPIGAFADGDGRFVIEGIPPGRYVLWVSPITDSNRYGGDFNPHADLTTLVGSPVIRDMIVPWPLSVEAGATTTTDPITVVKGRRLQ